MSGTGRSEKVVSHLVHLGSHRSQAGFLRGTSISEAGDRLGQIRSGSGNMPNPFAAAA